MIAVLQYICNLISQSRTPDEKKRNPLTLLCESNEHSVTFDKVGIGMIEFDPGTKDAMPTSLKEKLLSSTSLTPLKLYDTAFELRPPTIRSMYFDVERVFQNAIIYIYRFDRGSTKESISSKFPKKLTFPMSSFFFQPKQEYIDKLLSNRTSDLPYTF